MEIHSPDSLGVSQSSARTHTAELRIRASLIGRDKFYYGCNGCVGSVVFVERIIGVIPRIYTFYTSGVV